ncbi:MAG: hypothetical protein AAFU64_14490, partial [Bacteroidota bacterium]
TRVSSGKGNLQSLRPYQWQFSFFGPLCCYLRFIGLSAKYRQIIIERRRELKGASLFFLNQSIKIS